MANLLDDVTIRAELESLPGWQHEDGKLVKTWQRRGLLGALVLASAIGYVCNEMKHYPNLTVHDYNRVSATLTTDDAGGVTATDIEAARRVEALVTTTPTA